MRFRPSPTEQLSSKLVLPMVPFTTSPFTPTPPPTMPPVSKLGRITPFCFSSSAADKHKRHQDGWGRGGGSGLSGPEDRTLTFHSVFLHLLHFGDAFPEVADEAGAVLLTRRHEDYQHLPLAAQDGRGEPDPVSVVCDKERKHHQDQTGA